MAKTFQQWMSENGYSNGYGPGYIYSKQGGSTDRAGAIKSWQAEEGMNSISEMMKGFQGVGDVGAPSTDNRFGAGLSDAESRLRSLLDNPDSVQNSAAYKFRVGQGQEALNRSMGAKGMLNSGNRLMDLMKYGQDMGSQEYDSQFGRLSGLLGTYGQGFVADKNANTNIYSATEAAKANSNRNALGWANLNWDMTKPEATTTSARSSGSLPNPFSVNMGGVW